MENNKEEVPIFVLRIIMGAWFALVILTSPLWLPLYLLGEVYYIITGGKK